MSDTNHVVIVGRLTRDAECRYTKGDRAVANFGVCWNNRRKDAKGDWADEPHYFDVTAWGKYAEDARLRKGARVMVEGDLRLEQWEAADGTKRSRVRINAESVSLLQSPTFKAQPTGDTQRDSSQAEREPEPGPPPNDDMPF